MIPNLLARRTVTLLRREVVGEDEYGSDVHVDVEIPVAGCSVQPRAYESVQERTDRRQQVITGLIVWAPPGTDIRATDAVRVDGVVYEVAGEVGEWRSPIGLLDHVQVFLTRTTG